MQVSLDDRIRQVIALVRPSLVEERPGRHALHHATRSVRFAFPHSSSCCLLFRSSLAHPLRSQLPLWALIAFACYSAAVIGWNIMFFPACPEASSSLQKARVTSARYSTPPTRPGVPMVPRSGYVSGAALQEIAEAQKDLRRKGIIE